jgi:hypothetical protein
MTAAECEKTQLQQATDCLTREISDGLRHGFFELAVTCETVNGKMRRVTIKAGKNHRFTIPEKEIE